MIVPLKKVKISKNGDLSYAVDYKMIDYASMPLNERVKASISLSKMIEKGKSLENLLFYTRLQPNVISEVTKVINPKTTSLETLLTDL